jgi:hypothetical protein
VGKFKPGDKVRIVKYGHPIFYKKEGYYKMMEYLHYEPSFFELLMGIEHPVREPYVQTPPSHLIWEDENYFTKDISPELVGQEGTIAEYYGGSYSIDGIPGKHAWYDEEQLELIE